MKNIKNLALARLHNDIQSANQLLKTCCITDEETVILYENIQEAMTLLDTIENKLALLAYGDCQFVHRLPYPVKPSVTRRRLHVFPQLSETETLQDVA